MRRHVVAVVSVMLAACLAAPISAQSWRIAYGGGRITGYVGLLAKSGLPRQFLNDEELASPDVLKDYRVVIVTSPVNDASGVSRALEQFVAAGGIAITEAQIGPSPQVLPGKRLGPKRSPNIIFERCDHPISRAMHGTGVVPTSGWQGMAIIPANDEDAIVLAEFTDEGVPQKYRGKLTGGRKHVPAALLIEHGEGAWLYFGAPVAVSLALRGPQMQPGILKALELLSDGALSPRFAHLGPDRRILPTVQWEAQTEETASRRAPRDAEPTDLPEGFEPLDLPEDAPPDFLVTGRLAPDARAELLLPWYNSEWHRRLEIGGGRLRLVEVKHGRERVVAEVPGPPVAEAGSRVDIRRRPTSLTVFVDGRAAMLAPLEPLAGTMGARGLGDAFLQPTAPVVFEDNFMRSEGDPNPWETPAGSWRVHQVEGDAEYGANPFAFQAEAGSDRATAIAGYEFWDDYDFSCAVRPDAKAAAIMAHWRADDDHVALRLTLPEQGEDATVELVRVLPGGEHTLASEPVVAARDRWHELRLRISRGHAVIGLDGSDLGHVADDLLRGSGRIGLQVAGGSAWFDDARVVDWEATPLPVDGQPAWRVERGRAETQGDALMLEPTGAARALAPTGEYASMRAQARIRLGDASQAGMLLRYRSPGDHYFLGLSHGDGVMLRLARRQRGEETVLAESRLSGDPDRWRTVGAVMRGRHIAVTEGDRVLFEAADDALACGEFGLACEGGPAHFARATCWPVDHELHRTDPPTPPYAGIIDKHTWAGAGSGWEPAPGDLDLCWHRGRFADDVQVRLGVHRGRGGAASATLALGDGRDLSSGYAARANQPSLTEPVTVSLTRREKQVGFGEAQARAGEGYALSLQRVGSLVVARINGEAVCEFRDPEPLADLTRVGFRRDDAIIDPADIEVFSSTVRTWTFNTAPADWRVESGTWEISNRWSCSPDWTWLAGWSQPGEALIRSRCAVTGDQKIDVYVGAKMMPNPSGRGHYEELRDLHFGMCGDGEGHGYRVILGGDNNVRSQILRNNQPVVSTTSYQIPQSERHNNWLLVTLLKSGPTISVRVWDREVLSYTDDEPIEGGFVSFGTSHNGIIVPRITVYGRRAEADAPLPEVHP